MTNTHAKTVRADRNPAPLDPAVLARLAAARRGDQDEFSGLTEPHRRELQVHCYRMLGSLPEAEDLVQETFLRAWRRLDSFEGRASFRAWLYKIATNACLDELDRKRALRRALPHLTHPPADPRQSFAPPTSEPVWLEPLPDDLLAEADDTPEARYALRESITLAFLAALQSLSPRQRAVVILCDVLDWRASEAADGLNMTLSAVNSALHRARQTLARNYQREPLAPPAANDPRTQALLDRYLRAWEAADVEALVALLREDTIFAMPPTPSWFKGPEAIRLVLNVMPFAGDAHGRWRLIATRANGQAAVALYQKDEARAGLYQGIGLQVLTVDGEALSTITTFMNPALLARFGLPPTLPESSR